jgi:hypothetical protein
VLFRSIHLLVRPHPFYASLWDGFSHPGVAVHPQGGDRPDSPQARQVYFDTLNHGLAALAINTTGFLDAAVADRPCLTVLDPRYERQQLGRAHFHHLLRAGFIQTAPDISALEPLLVDLLAGADPQAAQRRRFVQGYLRPSGLDRPAGEVMAQALVDLAQGHRPTLINPA